MIKSYLDLEVYRRSYELALTVHRLSLEFPDFEKYELGKQLRRASKSIPANIAEGYGQRSSVANFKRFLLIAQGSCDEVKVWLDMARDLGYIKGEEAMELKGSYMEVGKMLNSLIRVWRV